MKRNERKMIQIIKEEYSNRLLRLYRESVRNVFEADMFDVEGNQLLSPGLKVRHKKSGYEYTVDHCEGEGDNAVVFLRQPEQPRFKPPESEAALNEGDEEEEATIKVDQVDLNKVMGVEDNSVQSAQSSQEQQKIMQNQPKASLLKITKKEFEKEYEVK